MKIITVEEYSIDYTLGEYICGNCKKRFPVEYYRKSKYGRTMSRRMMGAPKANFNRHLISCYKLLEDAEIKGEEK